jgi:hypothetical protein
LLRFLAVSLCDGRFSCSSDDALLCVVTRIGSPIAYRLWVLFPLGLRRLRRSTMSLST